MYNVVYNQPTPDMEVDVTQTVTKETATPQPHQEVWAPRPNWKLWQFQNVNRVSENVNVCHFSESLVINSFGRSSFRMQWLTDLSDKLYVWSGVKCKKQNQTEVNTMIITYCICV